MTNSKLAALIQKFGTALEGLKASDIDLLVNNKAVLALSVTPISSQRSLEQVGGSKLAKGFDVLKIAQELDQALTREEGSIVLGGLSKAQLLNVAKHLAVSVDSSVSKEKLIASLVERKVGLRLRQEAFSQVMSLA